MNKKNTIIIAVATFAFLVVVLVLSFIQPSHQVKISFDRKNLTAKVSAVANNKSTEITTITDDSTLKLASGNYEINVTSKDNIVKEQTVKFTVKNSDTEVAVKTEYSLAYVNKHLDKNRSEFESVLFNKYPELKTNYSLYRETMTGDDMQWYIAAYQEPDEPGGNVGDIYTVILHKSGGKWTIVARPQLINTPYNTSDVPEKVLSEAFNLAYREE